MSRAPTESEESAGSLRLVLTTFGSREAAEKAVDQILAGRLAACANLVPVRSKFWWRGRRESAEEVLVLLKTAPKNVGALRTWIAEHHPYEVPEVVELDAARVGASYLDYVADVLGEHRTPRGDRPLRRSGAPKVRGARSPGRTPTSRRRQWKRS